MKTLLNILYPFLLKLSNTFPLFVQYVQHKLGGNDYLGARKKLLDYYKIHLEEIKDKDIENGLSFIKKRGLSLYPYAWTKQYQSVKVNVYSDNSGLQYVMHQSKKLYFRRGTPEFKIKRAYVSLLEEQDQNSPHCYLNGMIDLKDDSLIFDVGAAEGIFALTNIEKAKYVYLFETDSAWIEALQKTFEPWKEKVLIINKFASDKDADGCVKLDSLLKDKEDESVFLKLDVEGAEAQVLNGAKEALTSDKLDVVAVVCTYHYAQDYAQLTELVKSYGYKYKTSKGYMCCFYDNDNPPAYFRRVMIYCSR